MLNERNQTGRDYLHTTGLYLNDILKLVNYSVSTVVARGWLGVRDKDYLHRGSFGGDENVQNIMIVLVVQTMLICMLKISKFYGT